MTGQGPYSYLISAEEERFLKKEGKATTVCLVSIFILLLLVLHDLTSDPSFVCRTERCVTRWTTSWEDKDQPPTFHQSVTPRLSIGNLFCPYFSDFSPAGPRPQTTDANKHTSSLKSKYPPSCIFTFAQGLYCRIFILYYYQYEYNIFFSFSHCHSKPIKLSTSSNKPLPFIKVIEIKS